MAISVFEMFKVGIGPSSSHTVGPMRAARRFLSDLREAGRFERVARVSVQLYGSLALTGKGHGTDRAILLGLEGETPDEMDPDRVDEVIDRIRSQHSLRLLGEREVPFDPELDLLFHKDQVLPGHANGMRFTSFDAAGGLLDQDAFYSVGGGFIAHEDDLSGPPLVAEEEAVPFPFVDAASLISSCEREGMALHELVRENERSRRDDATIDAGLDQIWSVMAACCERGMRTDGVLPGGLEVKRRAAKMLRDLEDTDNPMGDDPMDWVNLWALAVNEENAAGGRVVTAPTNGAAGIIPAVLQYYLRFVRGADQAGIRVFLLTAGVIGILYKRNASISGAEMGCQGEVGVACSMAAAGLAATMGATNAQVENAAEIGMEHNLGLTCDPVGGLVQIPCIERNAMGALKAINAARLALRGDGSHKVSLDQVIATMRQTGEDMRSSYKETSLGGLAVNVIEC
jgi:L-serine dehydratase